MTTRAIVSVLIQIPWIFACFRTPAAAPAGKRLWVLREPKEIIECDPITFAIRRSLQVPRQAVNDLPAVEILKLGDPPRRISMIPHATLAGWLNDKEIVIVQDQVLVIYDMAGGTRRQSQIRIPEESCVYVR